MTRLLIAGLCALFIVMAVPLILRKVPPNGIYGFRTRKTMASESAWYQANRFFGSGLVISSAVSLLLVAAMPPSFVHEFGLLILVLPVGVLLVVSAFYQRTL